MNTIAWIVIPQLYNPIKVLIFIVLNGLILMGNIEKFNDKDKFLKQFESLRPDLFFPEEWSDEDKSKAVVNEEPFVKMLSTVAFTFCITLK